MKVKALLTYLFSLRFAPTLFDCKNQCLINRTFLFLVMFIAWTGFTHAQIEGSTQAITFTGPVTSESITFTLYLPPNYDTNTDKDYPVVYHLHGVNGTHDGNQISTVPAAFELAQDSGLWDEAIIVFPDGYLNSMWSDSYDDAKPAETNVIEEIIPYIDNNYRTIGNKDHRLIQGFSMGGFGALKLFAKYPDLFCRVVTYDGALHDWTTLTSNKPTIATEIFNDDSTLFNAEASPWTFLEQNASLYTTDTLIYITVGALTNYNSKMDAFMNAHGILHGYVLTGCPHTTGCMVEIEGNNAAIFESKCLNTAPKYTVSITNGSGSGDYEEGETVSISAIATPPTGGQEFDQWTGDISVLTSVYDSIASFTMPKRGITLTATYKDLPNSVAKNETSIKVYPNPASGILNIQANKQFKSISLLDMTGKMVLQTSVDANDASINVSGFAKGIYFIRMITNEQDLITTKIVIQ